MIQALIIIVVIAIVSAAGYMAYNKFIKKGKDGESKGLGDIFTKKKEGGQYRLEMLSQVTIMLKDIGDTLQLEKENRERIKRSNKQAKATLAKGIKFVVPGEIRPGVVTALTMNVATKVQIAKFKKLNRNDAKLDIISCIPKQYLKTKDGSFGPPQKIINAIYQIGIPEPKVPIKDIELAKKLSARMNKYKYIEKVITKKDDVGWTLTPSENGYYASRKYKDKTVYLMLCGQAVLVKTGRQLIIAIVNKKTELNPDFISNLVFTASPEWGAYNDIITKYKFVPM